MMAAYLLEAVLASRPFCPVSEQHRWGIQEYLNVLLLLLMNINIWVEARYLAQRYKVYAGARLNVGVVTSR